MDYKKPFIIHNKKIRSFSDVKNNWKSGRAVSLISILLSALLAEAAELPP